MATPNCSNPQISLLKKKKKKKTLQHYISCFRPVKETVLVSTDWIVQTNHAKSLCFNFCRCNVSILLISASNGKMAGAKLLMPRLQYRFIGCVHLLFTVYGFAYMTSFQNKEKKCMRTFPQQRAYPALILI